MKKVLDKILMFFLFLLFAVLFMGISYWGFTDELPRLWNTDFGFLHFIAKPFILLFMGTLITLMGLLGLFGLYAAFGSLFSKG